MKCSICQGKAFEYGTVEGYKIFKCEVCGLGETENKKLPNYRAYHRDSTYKEEWMLFRNIFLKRWQIIKKFVSKGKVLDVGSSVGTMLSIFKEDSWDVLGIEPSGFAASEALKRGIPTRKNTFESVKLKDREFDVVIFNHVLEHVDNPLVVLSKANKVLKKGGIVLVDVPNFGSLRSKLQEKNWGYLYPSEHKWHFTKESLFNILKKSGYEVVHSETRSGVWDCGDPMLEIWRSFKDLKLRFFKNLVFLVPNYFISILGLGSGVTVVGRKK